MDGRPGPRRGAVGVPLLPSPFYEIISLQMGTQWRSGLLLFLLSCGSSAFAQTGGITGNVVDLAGKPVPNAEIQATHSATNTVFKVKTSTSGAFALEQLPTGTYRLTSAPPGFNPFNRPGVVVSESGTLRLDLRLEDRQLNTLGDGRDYFDDIDASQAKLGGPVPRFADGKPDLSGVWYRQKTVDPGNPKLKPWAAVVKRERDANFNRDNPPSFCLPGKYGD